MDDIRIVVATEPTELIVSDGPAVLGARRRHGLALHGQHRQQRVSRAVDTAKYYVLLSGRWYRGEGLLGDLQWSHVPNDELPEPFGDIPEDSVNGAVLSQVAGTEQARDAVLDNTIPQTAAIKRDDDSFSVEYDGTPAFAPIEEIDVMYAQNTSAAVFRYGNLYYACDNGVWYVSNMSTGPWTVATDIPEAIYRDSRVKPASQRYVCEGLRRNATGRVRRLHARLLRQLLLPRFGCLRIRLVLQPVVRPVLLSAVSDLGISCLL